MIYEEAFEMPEQDSEIIVKKKWSCGHVAEGVCGRCYGDLVVKAEQLREENDMLREAILMTGNLLLEAGSQP